VVKEHKPIQASALVEVLGGVWVSTYEFELLIFNQKVLIAMLFRHSIQPITNKESTESQDRKKDSTASKQRKYDRSVAV